MTATAATSTGGLEHLRGRVTKVISRDERTGETIARLAPEGDNPGRVSMVFWGMFPTGFSKGEVLRLEGRTTRHPDHPRILRVSRLERTPPSSRQGEIAFLSGHIQGMSRAQAERLLEEVGGLDALIEICQKQPARLDELLPKAKKIRARLRSARWRSEVRDLDAFVTLQSAGLRANQVQALVKFFGGPGLRQIAQQNPYEFCQVPKVGFASAEKVARFYAAEQGREFDPMHPDRLVYGICDVVARQRQSGHVCVSPEELVRAAVRQLELPRTAATKSGVETALATALARRLLVKDFDMIYTRGLHKAESDVSMHIAKLLASSQSPLTIPADTVRRELRGSGLSDEQIEAVVVMARSPLSLLIGGPGRGKTRTLKSLLDLLAKYNRRVLMLAPTGKAAKRAAEVAGRPCFTIHKACGLEAEEDVHSRKYGRRLGRRDRLTEDVVVVDETSMVDLALGFELLRRIRAGKTSVIFVGDPDQLPPVGAGQLLKDLLSCGRVPIAMLTQVFRQANGSPIVDGADALNTGRTPEFRTSGYEVRLFDPTSVRGHPGGDGDDALAFEVSRIRQWLVQAVDRYAKDLNINRVRDVQVYAPQKSGPLGLEELNRAMQQHLNGTGAPGPRIGGGVTLRVGDKVMQIQNNYKLRRRDSTEEVSVMNGQIGYVVFVSPERVEVQYDDVPTPVLYQQSTEWRQLTLAYAISIHRSQGSETPYAFIVLHRSMNPRLVNRPLIYTGWTRAKSGVAVFGSLDDVTRAAVNLDGTERNSNLGRRIVAATAGAGSRRAPIRLLPAPAKAAAP